MSGEEELAPEELQHGDGEEGGEGGDNMDDAELAQMQKELEKAEQQKAELDKLNKMQGGVGGSKDSGKVFLHRKIPKDRNEIARQGYWRRSARPHLLQSAGPERAHIDPGLGWVSCPTRFNRRTGLPPVLCMRTRLNSIKLFAGPP